VTNKMAVSAPSANQVDQSGGGWFIYVDTYAQGTDADSKAQQIEDAGYAAKVAVEYRSGELLYRVQIVGINTRTQGEEIIQALAAGGDMPNLQLRQY
jgi:biotin carboxylase